MKTFYGSNEEPVQTNTAQLRCNGLYNLALFTGSGQRAMQNKSKIMQHENRYSCCQKKKPQTTINLHKILDQQSSKDW